MNLLLFFNQIILAFLILMCVLFCHQQPHPNTAHFDCDFDTNAGASIQLERELVDIIND